MKRKFLQSSCLLAVLLLSCSAGYAQSKRKIQKEMDSWMGATKKELLMSYGPASRTTSDGDGGEILVFSDQVVHDNPSLVSDGNGGLQVQQNMPYVYYRHKMYYINSSGRVYHWRYDKNKVPPDRLMIQGGVDLNVYNR